MEMNKHIDEGSKVQWTSTSESEEVVASIQRFMARVLRAHATRGVEPSRYFFFIGEGPSILLPCFPPFAMASRLIRQTGAAETPSLGDEPLRRKKVYVRESWRMRFASKSPREPTALG